MTAAATDGTTLRKDAVGVMHIVFFVIAAAAPLTVIVGVSPAAFAFGNGPGVPGTYVIVGAVYILFSLGFTTMNRFVSGSGGFYPYIARGLGRPFGVAGAFIALATYNAIDISAYGLFGYFGADIVHSLGGPSLPWWTYTIVLSAAVFLCGMRNIEFSGSVLGVCMVAEISILTLLGIVILAHGGGPQGVALAPFGPASIMTPGLGVALVFVVTSFIGFEATVIFGEEARNPARTIPRATYIAVTSIAVFYAFCTWCIALHYGPAHIAKEAADHTTTLYLTPVRELLGPQAGWLLNLLLMISLFACCLSFHNTINRYLFAIGREGLAWNGFGRTHARHQSPFVAGAAQTAFALGITLLFALTGQDPYAVVFAWMGTFASLGILAMQILVSLAVIMFFARDARGIGLVSRLLAPGLSGAALVVCLGIMIANLALISGSESRVVEYFPVLVVLIGACGAGLAVWLRSRRPDVYRRLGHALD